MLYMPHDMSSGMFAYNAKLQQKDSQRRYEVAREGRALDNALESSKAQSKDVAHNAASQYEQRSINVAHYQASRSSAQKFDAQQRHISTIQQAASDFFTQLNNERSSAYKMDASSRITKSINDLTSDANEGYRLQRGAKVANNKDFVVEYLKKFDDRVSGFENSPDKHSSEWVKYKVATERENFRSQLMEHFASQVYQYKKESSQSLIDVNVDTIAKNFGNLQVIAKSASEIQAAAFNMDLSPDGASVAFKENLGRGIYKAVANAIGAQNFGAAKALVNTFGKSMDADTLAAAKKMIASEKKDINLNSYASQLLSSHNYDYPSALSKLKTSGLKSEDRDAVAYNMRVLATTISAGTYAKERKIADEAWAAFNTRLDIGDIPKDIMNSLNPADKAAILKQKEINIPGSKARIGSNPSVYVSVMDLADNPSTRDEFMMVDVRRYPDWKPEWRESVINRQSELSSSNNSRPEISSMIQKRSLGISDPKRRAEFKADAHIALEMAQKEKGKSLTVEEADKTVGLLFIKQKNWFSSGYSEKYKPLSGKDYREMYDELSGR